VEYDNNHSIALLSSLLTKFKVCVKWLTAEELCNPAAYVTQSRENRDSPPCTSFPRIESLVDDAFIDCQERGLYGPNIRPKENDDRKLEFQKRRHHCHEVCWWWNCASTDCIDKEYLLERSMSVKSLSKTCILATYWDSCGIQAAHEKQCQPRNEDKVIIPKDTH